MAGPTRPLYRSAIDQIPYLRSIDDNEDEDSSGQAGARTLEDLQCSVELADDPYLNLSVPADRLPFGLGARYWLDARKFDPAPILGDIQKPVLVLQGGRDYQVSLKDDYSVWCAGLKDNKDAQCLFYETLNHLFISGEGPPNPAEYEKPGNVEEVVLRDLADWIWRLEAAGAAM
jgi:uncharacterized protein